MNISTLCVNSTGSKKINRLIYTCTSLLFVFILLITGQTSTGQSLVETFNYTVAGNIGGNTAASGTTNNNWTTHSNSQTGTVSTVTGSLSYTGINPANNRVNIPGSNTTTPRDINRACGLAASQNTTYYSFLLNVIDATQLATSFGTGGNGYFFHLSTTNGSGASNFTAKVHIRSSNAAANFRLGVSETGNTPVEVTGDLAFGTTYLVVVKYVYNNTAGNDLATMWVNPSSLGTTEPVGGVNGSGSANVASYNSSNTGICIRNASATPKADIDEIRVGTTWAQVTLQNVDGFIVGPEYGTHTDGQNQQTNSGNVTYMKWDDNNLFVGVSGANLAEGYVLYFDKDPQVPVDGGSNSNGTNIGQIYDGTNFAALPFRADLVMYVKTGYREYRTSTGSNTWSAANTSFGNYAATGTVREFSIPWSAIGGKPTSFNWFGYNTSAGGFVYNQTPNENAGGNIGASARYERYYTVNVTTTGSSTPPFSRNSFVFNNTADENSFGAISVYDFTMNTSGRFISRSGATNQNWTIAGNMVVGNGIVYFGSGGTNGSYGSTTVTGNLDIRGGTLDMDQTTSPLTVNGNLALSSGTFKLSGNGFGGGDLNIKGNWSNTGGTFTPGGRIVLFNAASGNQTITRSGGETFDNLSVDKAAGSVVLANDITVNQVITLTNGTVNTAANKVILASNATSALARTNGYVNGFLQRAINTGVNTYNFAVGTSLGYTPASLAFTAVGAAGNITMSSADAVGANYPAILNATKRLARSWSSLNSGVTGITGSATFTYLPADLVGGAVSGSMKAYVFNGSTSYTTSNTNTSNSFTYNGLTTVGEFGAGECGTSLAPTFTKTMVSACGGGADGTITVTPVGGVAPYTYNWTSTPGGFSGNTAAVTGLTARDYTVVTTDAIGCTKSIPDITIFQVFATVVTNNGGGSGSCANTGYILLYGSGGVQPYTYSIDGTNYFASNSFTALAAGTYTGYVKDLGGCVSTKPGIVVTGAAPIVVTAFTRPATSCANNGTIELYRTGGMPSFTYSLDDITYQGGNTFNNLAGATTYTGWVKDAAGCKTSLAGIVVGKAPSITVSVTKLNTSPCSNSGSLIILAGGGVPGYNYSITGPNGTYQASNAFTGLAAGTYDVWVRDSKGCKQSNFANIIGTNAAPVITVTAYPRSASSCANNGSIELYRTGGTGPFTYSLDNITYQASNTFTGLAGGTFTGWVKDVNGCTGSLAGIIVTQSPAVTITESHTNTSTCVNDATIQLTPGGGVPGYTYSLDNITYQAGNSFIGLAAGNYTGWTKDSKGCTASVPVTIGTNAAIVVTAYVTAATNCETGNGSIQLFRTGGTSPFTFSLTNVTYQAGNLFSGLFAGSYTGYIKDSKGCIGSLANIVVGPNCAPPTPGVFTKNSAVKITGNTVLKANVFPNPSASEFTLVLSGNSNEKVIMNVTDIMGRNIYNVIENSKQQIRFGNNFKPGIYTIQVIQGDQKQTIKLIKE